MRKHYLLLRLTFISGSLLSSLNALPQSDVSGLIKSGPADATKLATAYLNPFFKGFGVGLNSGWTNTAHSKNTGRFELRFGLTGALIPKKDEVFDVSQIGLSSAVRPTNSNQTLTPTVAGSKSNGASLTVYDGNNNPVETFTMPKGANLPVAPSPQLQGTIGLPKGIDLTVRAMPKVNLGDKLGSVSLMGAGVKVEVLPLLAGKKVDRLFPLDVAMALGYTRINYRLPLNVRPESGSFPKDNQQSQDFSNQMIDATFSGLNVEAIVSKKLLFFTPFLSVGYNTAQTNAGLKGYYPIVTGAALAGSGTSIAKTYTSFKDPVTIKQRDVKSFRSDVGFQLNMAFLRLYTSYSMSDYNSVNFGLGVGLGK